MIICDKPLPNIITRAKQQVIDSIQWHAAVFAEYWNTWFSVFSPKGNCREKAYR